MYNRSDPRFQRTINQISSNFESANESAQIGLFSLSENYIKPCLGSVGACLQQNTEQCFPRRDDRLRRNRSRTYGRPELSFDFYDDWEADETDALLSPQNDEFDRLLGAGEEVEPSSRNAMNYGTQNPGPGPSGRRRSVGIGRSGTRDPTVIPTQSYLGFLERLPFKIGTRGLRYQPSAADLQERPRAVKKHDSIAEHPNEDNDTKHQKGKVQHGRKRSHTAASQQSEHSLSSRGDIFPSDDEDDAIPLSDEFAVALDRRKQGARDDASSGKTKSSKGSAGSKSSSRSSSSKSLAKSQKSKKNDHQTETIRPNMGQITSTADIASGEESFDSEAETKAKLEQNMGKRAAEDDASRRPSEEDKKDLDTVDAVSINVNDAESGQTERETT